MKKILIILFLLSCQTLFAQKKALVTRLEATIYSAEKTEGKNALINFARQKGVSVSNQTESQESFLIEMNLTEFALKKLDSLILTLGYIESRNLQTVEDVQNYSKDSLRIVFLQKKMQTYQNEISKMDSMSNRYFKYWEDIRTMEEEIYQLQANQIDARQRIMRYSASVRIYRESIEKGISFVNMPGIEYSMLFVESPNPAVSTQRYAGYSLKYMFTKGKSYFNVGAMKAQNRTEADSLGYSELFLVGFGQDFYTRYLGRGKNRFFNLYTGYNVGVIVATNDKRNKTNFYTSAFLGVELLKTKHIILDAKGGYFLPFTDNRNLRGISVNLAFNFVF